MSNTGTDIDIYISNINIEEEYEKIKHGWFVNEANTMEEKKEEVRRNMLAQREFRNEIARYMETDEYKNEYSLLKKEYEEKGEQMDPEKIYNMRSGTRCTIIEHTNEEKIALGIKGICEEKERKMMVEKYIPTGEFIEGTDYIFFSIENGGFACRNILVPSKEFKKIHSADLEMLRRNAQSVQEHNTATHELFTIYDCKNLDERGRGVCSSIPNEFSTFIVGMMPYAECDTHHGVFYSSLDGEDCDMDTEREWYIKSICDGYGHFSQKSGYESMAEKAKKHGCSISESFFFLEKRINYPSVRKKNILEFLRSLADTVPGEE